MERHYHLNYHEFLDTFESIVKDLDLCGDGNDGELKNDVPENNLVYDVHAVRSDLKLATGDDSDDDDYGNSIEMNDINPKDSEKILEEFKNRFFRKMKRLVLEIFLR